MIIELQILKHDNGGVRIGVEVKDMVENLKWVTDLDYSAEELAFDVVNDKDPMVSAMGAIIDFARDNKDIFWGFVFNVECASDVTMSVKAYDLEGYLGSEGSVVFQSGTLEDRYSNVCRRFGTPFHIRKQPTYRMPAKVCDGKTGFDIIENAIDKTYSATGEVYCIVADHVYIELRRALIPTRTFLVIDAQNTMSDYTYPESIDNAANVVQVIQKNTDNSQTKTVTVTSDTEDDPATTNFAIASARGNTIRTWGQIIKVVNAKSKANWAQMIQQANDGLEKRNVPERKLTLDCVGDTSLITGAGADVKIKDSGKTWANCPVLKAAHNFGTDYTCSLEMRVSTEWQENSL